MNAGSEISLPGLQTERLGRPCRFFERTDSTNDRIWAWVRDESAPHGACCVARQQTGGRGRQGRTWESPAGRGLYASLLIRPPHQLAMMSSFSLVVALVAARTVDEMTGVDVGVKWPNDLWAAESVGAATAKKLGGILLEALAVDGSAVVVVGLGINLDPPKGGWKGELAGRAISLRELGGDRAGAVDSLAMWAAFLDRLEPAYERFLAEGFGSFRGEWDGRDRLKGMRVMVESEGPGFAAQVEGVDEVGQLIVRRDDGEICSLNAGEVHLASGAER